MKKRMKRKIRTRTKIRTKDKNIVENGTSMRTAA